MKNEYYLNNKEKIKEYQRQYRLTHKEECKERNKQYKKKNRQSLNEYQNKWFLTPKGKLYRQKNWEDGKCRKYGLTVEQIEQMTNTQNGMCAICSKKFESSKDTHIDHNHTTNKVR
jgi:hypothetical protein